MDDRSMTISDFVLQDASGCRFVSVPAFLAKLAIDPETFPRSIRIIIESALRTWATDPAQRSLPFDIVKSATGRDTLAFPIGRVLLQDAAGIPLLVDLAAMRDAVVEAGKAPDRIRPRIPVAMVIDHSIQSHHYGTPDAYHQNLEEEFASNSERYAFVKWAQQAFPGLTVVPPGNGIVHQVHMESLAEIVSARDGWIFCDTVIGTDSHTTMINGLGVLGWGVGGIEAEAALLGEFVDMARPEVVGVEITGRPAEKVLAADIALTLTKFLRSENVVGCFLEFFGDGLDHLSVEDRCTIANMAPEYGATLALFPTDDDVMQWLGQHGRAEMQVAAIRAHLERQGLFGRQAERIFFDRKIVFNLSDVVPCVAGPTQPDQTVPLVGLKGAVPARNTKLDGRVVLAAITSCTNTANPASVITAGLLARSACAAGLSVDKSIKTVFAPGSRAVFNYLSELDLLKPLEQLGFAISAYGCAVCVGNSGRLAAGVEEEIHATHSQAVAVLSGNRNFEARIHPAIRSAYLMNPVLVVAFALAGRISIDFLNEPIGQTREGEAVFLADLWPPASDIDRAVRAVKSRPTEVIHPKQWSELPVEGGQTFAWNATSTYFVRPPFFEPSLSRNGLDIRGARPLLVLGDGVTTDHISPVGRIDPGSAAAHYLNDFGVMNHDLNTYAARRGNHHVMVRGTFSNARLRNLLVSTTEGAWTRHLPSGRIDRIHEVAECYKVEGRPTIVVAGARYGSGSARDWAAKGTALLGVRAVVAKSFERIHRSNLVRLGVLPIQIPQMHDEAEILRLLCESSDVEIDIEMGRSVVRPECSMVVKSADGVARIQCVALIDTPAERRILEFGDLFKSSMAKAIT